MLLLLFLIRIFFSFAETVFFVDLISTVQIRVCLYETLHIVADFSCHCLFALLQFLGDIGSS